LPGKLRSYQEPARTIRKLRSYQEPARSLPGRSGKLKSCQELQELQEALGSWHPNKMLMKIKILLI